MAAGTLLQEGEHVIVCFTPPGWWLLGELSLWARVARAAPRREGQGAVMALELLDLPAGARDELARVLSGRPPPLPRARPSDRVWVDPVDEVDADVALRPKPLAPLLTGGRRAYRSRHAV